MRLQNRLISAYVHHRAVFTLLGIMVVLEVLFVARLFFPQAMTFILDLKVFEIVVLLAIGQMILLLVQLLYRTPRRTCEDEHECQVLVREVITTDRRAHSLHVFSSGLGSRLDFLTTAHLGTDRSFSTQVVAQDPGLSPDRQDGDRMRHNLAILERDHPEVPLEIRLSKVPASIRAMIVCDASGNPFWAVASWYVYQELEDSRVRVVGRRNPSLVLTAGASAEDKKLLDFLLGLFRQTWAGLEGQVAFAGADRSGS